MSEFLDWYKNNKNNISYWFPKVENCGIAVPRTIIINTNEDVAKAFFMDNREKDLETVMNFVKEEVLPKIPKDMFFLFMKNGTFSNKYDFKTCKVRKDLLELTNGLIEIMYMSEMVGAGGMSEIAIREFIGSYNFVRTHIPTIYSGMPLRPEFRVFYDFDNRKVMYSVNYWNYDYCAESICENATDEIVYKTIYPSLNEFYNNNFIKVEDMVSKAMENVDLDGKWSVDIMYDEESDEYYLIDMAIAEQSAYFKNDENYKG